MNFSGEKYYLNPRTGLPLFVEQDNVTIDELYALEFCTTQRDASEIMSRRIERICKLIQISWKEHARTKRWVGEAYPPAKIHLNVDLNMDNHVYIRGEDV